jgi:hypothetical protein
VSIPEDRSDAPEPFRRGLESLRAARLRPEVVLEEAPAPQRLAPFAVALTADVMDGDTETASGRFVVLHDPDGHEAWQGVFRVVTFVRAPLEPELADDAVLPAVGWSWLTDALHEHRAHYSLPSGTVTRVLSEHFGDLADRGGSAEVELRASWTASDPLLGAHLAAWADLLCQAAGMPPLPLGVAAIPRPRR